MLLHGQNREYMQIALGEYKAKIYSSDARLEFRFRQPNLGFLTVLGDWEKDNRVSKVWGILLSGMLESSAMNGSESSPSIVSEFLELPPLPTARSEATRVREKLDNLLSTEIPNYTSEDASFVVFGSLARGEWTSASDLDWTYLIDGQANSDHLAIAQKMQTIFERNKEEFRSPSPTGTFGNLAFSHDMIHQIGGQNDTNRNTTQRILLLLESTAIGKNAQAHERIIRGVINRYLEEDNHLLERDETRYRVPRFLLNDVVRFWRTMAVDFASKQRDRAGKGWGLRNSKLRMSRKLIFASGLLVCFGCNLDSRLQNTISAEKSDIRLDLVNHIRERIKLTSLEVLANAMHMYGFPRNQTEELFRAYAEFLTILDDPKSRGELEDLRAADSRTNPTFNRVRKISQAFERGLDLLFFENSKLAPLTRKYGVF
jgi:predicted nucleotidyltransferase